MENITSEKKKKTEGLDFLIFRVIFVILVAISIMGIRYINRDIYCELKKYYDDYFSVNITAEYYLSEVE